MVQPTLILAIVGTLLLAGSPTVLAGGDAERPTQMDRGKRADKKRLVLNVYGMS